jgi:tRNA G10  N-methylase Trm11
MKNQDKNFRGNPNRKDSIASTLRELRGMGSGRKANEANTSKPEDKSRYVASNGKPYAGPAFGNSKPSAAKKEDKKMTLAERIRKRRTGTA